MTLWSGRFSSGPGDTLWRFTTDASDRRLLVDDITGSLAHVGMLGEVELLPGDIVERIEEGLEHILEEAHAVGLSSWPPTKTSTPLLSAGWVS